jgi:hypothetical protein
MDILKTIQAIVVLIIAGMVPFQVRPFLTITPSPNAFSPSRNVRAFSSHLSHRDYIGTASLFTVHDLLPYMVVCVLP